MRYTVINFTRFGDLLQMQSMLHAIKQTGQHEISVICLDNFADATNFIREIDHVARFKGHILLNKMNTNWRSALQEIHTWIEDYYQSFQPDVVINLTASTNCRIFAQLIAQKNDAIIQQGFCMDKEGFGYNSTAWTSYVQAVSQVRGCSPFHLTDGFRQMLDLPKAPYILMPPQKNLQETWNHALTHAIANQETTGFVAFQLGASDEKRQWDINAFVELGSMLWQQKKLIPIILGSANEKAIAENFSHLCKQLDTPFPYVNFCGKTNLNELGALLYQCQCLVSNDTGTLHLAVGLNIPVVGIYLATAQVWDTGPYGENHICLEPRMECHPCAFETVCPHDFACRKHIQAKSVFHSIQMVLNKDFNTTITSHDARIWHSFFDPEGYINYQSLSHDETDTRTLWIAYQRFFYARLLHFLDSKTAYPTPATISPLDTTFKSDTIAFIETSVSLLLLLKEQCTMLNLRPSIKIKENFLANIHRTTLHLKQNVHFTPLYLLWQNMIQERSEQLEALIHFFDILREELTNFTYLIDKTP